MEKDPLKEFNEFLQPETRLDLKAVSLDHLLGLSSSEEGIGILLKNEEIIRSVMALTDDQSDKIAKSALLFFVNLAASVQGAREILKLRSGDHRLAVSVFVGYVLNPNKSHADAASMVLSNMTRLEDELDECVDALLPQLNDLLNVFVITDFNKTGSKLHYLAPMLSNLSRSHRIRQWLVEENPHVPLIKLLPFCNYQQSNIRRGGAIGTIRNLTFANEYHDFLLSSDLDLLTYLLNPLMGNEDYADDEMDMLPIALQYLPKEKQRDPDVDIRKMLIEILNRLCAKRTCREVMRKNGVYYVLREYHKWEKDPHVLLACEKVVDILIRKEEEIGVDDITTVEVVENMKEKFDKMDEDFIKSV